MGRTYLGDTCLSRQPRCPSPTGYQDKVVQTVWPSSVSRTLLSGFSSGFSMADYGDRESALCRTLARIPIPHLGDKRSDSAGRYGGRGRQSIQSHRWRVLASTSTRETDCVFFRHLTMPSCERSEPDEDNTNNDNR